MYEIILYDYEIAIGHATTARMKTRVLLQNVVGLEVVMTEVCLSVEQITDD